MRQFAILLMIIWGLAFLPSCDPSNRALGQARTLRIGYTIGKEMRYVFLSDADVHAVLAHFEVVGTREGQAGLIPNGTVDFHFSDGRIVRTMFLDPDRLDRAYGGQLFIKEAFYEKINEFLTKKEGRPIDIMKNN